MTVPGTSFSAQAENVIVGSPTIGVPALVSMTRPAMRFARKRYDQQRSNASSRRIPWQIKFPAWIAIWWSSGHWHERGKRRGQWVMARPGDIGPYREGNVAIVPNAVNASEGHLGKPRSAEVRRRPRERCKALGEAGWRHAVNARIGTHHSPETRARMSASQITRQARERAEREVAP
jgi:hypothetical protein